MPRDIDGLLDDIDRLVDEQLAAGPVDDYNANRYSKCPHCDRDWHGIAITERIANMHMAGRYDEGYRVVDDESRVLCPGSDFIGPVQALRSERETASDYYQSANLAFRRARASIMRDLARMPASWTMNRWWETMLPTDGAYRYDHASNQVVIRVGYGEVSVNAENFRAVHSEPMVDIYGEDITRVMPTQIRIQVLAEAAPSVGGTWVSLTAPGVTALPRRGIRAFNEWSLA